MQIAGLLLLPRLSCPALFLPHLQSLPLTLIVNPFHFAGTSDPSHRGSRAGTLVFAAADGCVAAWRLEDAYAAIADGMPPPPPLRLLGTSGNVECMAFNAAAGLLAVCDGYRVAVVDVATAQASMLRRMTRL